MYKYCYSLAFCIVGMSSFAEEKLTHKNINVELLGVGGKVVECDIAPIRLQVNGKFCFAGSSCLTDKLLGDFFENSFKDKKTISVTVYIEIPNKTTFETIQKSLDNLSKLIPKDKILKVYLDKEE
jgi:hypothetical protein